jgi:glycosyltransferase involved in cell wall biosynthesis
MKSPRVTILMPALDARRLLAGNPGEHLAQTCGDFELLAIDDGSTDRTPDVLAACRDPRLRVLRNEKRLKLAGALNRGLDEARSEFVARMDADDLMRPDRLAGNWRT